MKLSFTAKFMTFCLFASTVLSKTAEEWKSRSIYQLLTDRFARTDGNTTKCDDLTTYCGGTFKGLQNNLDYIQGMGFDAIWISPVVSNTPGGYHGYWANNIYEVNENFGTSEELHELIEACHKRDIWIMVDVVANHVGEVEDDDYTLITPFNETEHYNPKQLCDNVDIMNGTAFEFCWLSGLPDLNQDHPFVRKALLNWVCDLVQEYDIDGLRLDTLPHVSRDFWHDFTCQSGVYTLGEVLNSNLPLLASYQGPVDGVLNYPLWSTLYYTFQANGSMNNFGNYYTGADKTWPDEAILGNFVNNHDNPRFLYNSTNFEGFKAALAFSICATGIPIVYYGDEQGYKGGPDPANRESLWDNMNTNSELYGYFRTLNKIRNESHFYEKEQIQRYSDDTMYAFSRGEILFAFTNSLEPQTKTVTNHPYSNGAVLCNILKEDGDCVEVRDGQFTVKLLDGEVKILAPTVSEEVEPVSHEALVFNTA